MILQIGAIGVFAQKRSEVYESSIGVAQAECTILTVSHKGSVYTYKDECRDIQSGEVVGGEGETVLTVHGPTAFDMFGTSYRYCGTKVQF